MGRVVGSDERWIKCGWRTHDKINGERAEGDQCEQRIRRRACRSGRKRTTVIRGIHVFEQACLDLTLRLVALLGTERATLKLVLDVAQLIAVERDVLPTAHDLRAWLWPEQRPHDGPQRDRNQQ